MATKKHVNKKFEKKQEEAWRYRDRKPKLENQKRMTENDERRRR